MLAEVIFGILMVYCIYKLIRRKICRPNYSGKVIWVTGASSGIGQSLAKQFNRRGGKVIISARNKNQLERVKKQCPFPQKIIIVIMDMTQHVSVRNKTEQIIQELKKNGEKLDVVVENAGVSMRCEFVDYPFQNHQSLFNVNVHGPFNHIQSFVKHMMENGEGQIVGISSLSAKLASSHRSSYAGSKNSFVGLLDSIRTQLSPFNITVSHIMPGYIKTNLSLNALTDKSGQKLGFTDKNIENGMDSTLFAIECVKMIYRKQNQCQISDMKFAPLIIAMRTILPEFIFFMMVKNAKNQFQAIREGKQKMKKMQ